MKSAAQIEFKLVTFVYENLPTWTEDLPSFYHKKFFETISPSNFIEWLNAIKRFPPIGNKLEIKIKRTEIGRSGETVMVLIQKSIRTTISGKERKIIKRKSFVTYKRVWRQNQWIEWAGKIVFEQCRQMWPELDGKTVCFMSYKIV